jgi:hypothetical protein
MRKRICKACNEGEVLETAVAGRRTRYRCVPDLEIPERVAIPTCNKCGAQYLDARATERLEEGLKEAWQRVLTEKAETAIEALKYHVPQRELERLLGLSGGYLSKLKGGKETSATLVAALMLLASDPVTRVEELRQAWETQPSKAARTTRVQKERISIQAMPTGKVLNITMSEPALTKGKVA